MLKPVLDKAGAVCRAVSSICRLGVYRRWPQTLSLTLSLKPTAVLTHPLDNPKWHHTSRDQSAA